MAAAEELTRPTLSLRSQSSQLNLGFQDDEEIADERPGVLQRVLGTVGNILLQQRTDAAQYLGGEMEAGVSAWWCNMADGLRRESADESR